MLLRIDNVENNSRRDQTKGSRRQTIDIYVISCHDLFSRHQYFQHFAHISFGYFPYWQTLLLYTQSGSSVDAAFIQENGKIQ